MSHNVRGCGLLKLISRSHVQFTCTPCCDRIRSVFKASYFFTIEDSIPPTCMYAVLTLSLCTADSGVELINSMARMQITPTSMLSLLGDKADWLFGDTFRQYTAMLAVLDVTQEVSRPMSAHKRGS